MTSVVTTFFASLDNTIYVQIRADEMVVRQLESCRTVTVRAIRPFTTDRLIVASPSAAKETLKKALAQIASRLRLAPVVVMHPMRETDDGLSEIEEDALRQLGYDLGARRVAVVVGQPLSDEAIRRLLRENLSLAA